MFTYIVKICKEQEELAEQQKEIKEFLQDVFKNYQGTETAPLRCLLKKKMLEMFEYPENFLVSVDSMWRSDTPTKVSFFVNLMVGAETTSLQNYNIFLSAEDKADGEEEVSDPLRCVQGTGHSEGDSSLSGLQT